MTFSEFPHLHRDYDIIETWATGIKLSGAEVKSIRARHISLLGTFIIEKNSQLSLLKCRITPFQKQHSNQDNDVLRPRQLLVHKKELREIMTKRKKGLSLIPSKVLSDGIRIVVEIALVRFKTKHDRRETIKRRESDREMARIIKSYQ